MTNKHGKRFGLSLCLMLNSLTIAQTGKRLGAKHTDTIVQNSTMIFRACRAGVSEPDCYHVRLVSRCATRVGLFLLVFFFRKDFLNHGRKVHDFIEHGELTTDKLVIIA